MLPCRGVPKILNTKNADRAIKKAFIKNKYIAPKKKSTCPPAIPYPAVQSGGINAVAMATPGITLLFSVLVLPIAPAMPPAKAIKTSHIVGLVRANNSSVVPVKGDIKKYTVAVKSAKTT